MHKPRLLIEGIGGIGGVVAGHLIRAGHEPVLVTGNETITSGINRDGLVVTTLEERFAIPARAFTSLDEVEGQAPFDIALLIMKASEVVAAARETLPLLHPGRGFMVTCQNGIVEDAVVEVVGEERVISGIVGWGGTMHGPGVYERTGPGEIHLGELDGRVTRRVCQLAQVLESVTPVVISTNIRGALWSKLAINSTITTMGALTGETLGVMLRDRRVRRALLMVYSEVLDTARALGIQLERIAADPWLLYLPSEPGLLKRLYKDALVTIIGHRYRRLKSSSLQSLLRGRRTEIDYLNGYVVEQADRIGISVPMNTALVRLIKEIEAGTRPVRHENMNVLLDAH